MQTTDEIIAYYGEQLALFRKMLTITESIRTLAKDGQIDKIEERLNKRQDIINQLKIIEKRPATQRKPQNSYVDAMTAGDKTSMLSLIKDIRNFLKKIGALDRQIRTFFDYEKEKIGGDIKRVSIGHRLIKKYIPSQKDIPKYFKLSI